MELSTGTDTTRRPPHDAAVRGRSLSHKQAHAEILNILTRAASLNSELSHPSWKSGSAEPKTTPSTLAPLFALYQHEGIDPRRGAEIWLDDFADTMRSTGLDVQVAALPDAPPAS